LLYFSLLTSCTYASAAVKITTTSLPNGTVGVAYSANIYAGGGCKPYRWSWMNLPSFFSAKASSDTSYLNLSGTPNMANLYTFSISVRGCGGRISTQSFTSTIAQAGNISVSLSPISATLNPGQTKQFTATVAGTTNQSVTWISTFGTISSSGLYTAPSVSNTSTATVKATSVANSTKSASATVTIQPATAPSVQHTVDLSWKASTSSNVVSYNVYRGTVSGGPYTKLGSGVASTLYTDSTMISGKTYYYVTTAVNNAGQESTYSNQTTAVIPSP
jgi:hypothetical protein